jgi:hypothetical protein
VVGTTSTNRGHNTPGDGMGDNFLGREQKAGRSFRFIRVHARFQHSSQTTTHQYGISGARIFGDS